MSGNEPELPANKESVIHDSQVDVALCVVGRLTTWSLLGFDGKLLTHGSKDNNVGIFLLLSEKLGNLVTNFSIWDLDIILGLTIISHQGKETIVRDIEKLVFLSGDVWNIHVVGGWAQLFKLLASENVDGDQVNLCVTVLSSLRGRHIDDLARTVLDNDETVLSQGRALHGESGRCASISGGIEGVLMLCVVVCHCEGL